MKFLKSGLRVICLVLVIICLVFPSIYSINALNEAIKASEQLQEVYDNQVRLLLNGWQTNMVQGAVIAKLVEVNNKLEESIKKPSYEYLSSVTVYIFQRSPESPERGAVGTGVVVKNTDGSSYILTNKHVCDKTGMTCVVVTIEDGKEVQIPVYLYKEISSDYDAQILISQRPIPGKQPIKGIAKAKPQDPLYLVGHHLGRPFIYGEGVFAGYDDQYIDLIQIPTLFGDSGSGVFDKNGNLVALVFAITAFPVDGLFTQVDNTHALAIDSDVLRMLLLDLVK